MVYVWYTECMVGCLHCQSFYNEFTRTIPGWWHTYPSEKYEFVSWDDDIPNVWKVIKLIFQTTSQISVIQKTKDTKYVTR